MEKVKKITGLLILSLLILIAVRKPMSSMTSELLKGVYETAAMPVFTINSWFDATFQVQCAGYIEELPGLRGTFIRIRNQLDYSLFSIPHAQKIIMGKQGYLFGEENIQSYLGLDFAGRYYLDVKVRELKQFQEELWKKKGILLVVIYTPDKATFFPELIPDRLLKKKRPENNYLYATRKCVEMGVNLIDFNRYFLSMKDTSRFPLYAKTGAHWSSYGAMIAADSLIRYLEKRLNINLPDLVFEQLMISPVAREEDDDISRTMNLFFRIRQKELAYPKIRFREDSDAVKPSALFIGDSYYWNWYKPGVIKNVFRNLDFWYYDRDVYPASFITPRSTWNLDLKSSIERQNIIILLQTSGRECDFGYGFVDRAWPEYDTSKNNRIKEIERYITSYQSSMNMFKEKAKRWNAPLEAVIRMDAIFAGNELLKKHKP